MRSSYLKLSKRLVRENHVQSVNCDSVTDKYLGFFYIINFGLSQEEVDRQFAIGKEIFKLPTEEKLQYRAELEKGGYNGYKPLGIRVRKTSLKRSSKYLIQRILTPSYIGGASWRL